MLAQLVALGTSFATGFTALALQGALIAYSIYETRRQRKKLRDARENSIRDRVVTIRSSNAPIQLPYGTTPVPALQLTKPFTHGDDRRFLSVPLALAGDEINAITDILFDGESIGPLDARGYVQAGSKYFWTRQAVATHRVDAAPASGGVIELEHTPVRIESVAYETTDNVTAYLDAGPGGYLYTGRSFALTTDLAQGRPLVITYKFSTPQRDLYTDPDFDGVSTTLPNTPIRVISVTYRYFPADDPGVTEGSTRLLSLTPEVDPGVIGDPEYTVSGAVVSIGAGVTLQASPNGDPQLEVLYEFEQDGVALVRVKKFLGSAAGERDPDLEVASAGVWTSAHLRKGVPGINVTIQYDEDYFPAGMPEITAVVEGFKLYDPRTGTTAFSNNPALAAAHYLTHVHGWNLPTTAIDWDSVAEAADDCDELVEYADGQTHARYTVDGVLYCDADVRSNVDTIAAAMAGWVNTTTGLITVRAAKARDVVATLGDDQLAGPIEVRVSLPYRDLFNHVQGQFINPDKRWAIDDFPVYPNDDAHPYVVEDGGRRITRDLAPFDLTTNVYRAQRLAKLALFRARQPLQEISVWSTAAARLQPGDVIEVDRELFGWDGKRFIIHEWNLDPVRMRVQLTIQEDAAEIYAVDYNEYTTPDPTPNTTLPDPRSVPPLTGVALSSGAGLYNLLPDGTAEPYLRFRWDRVENSAVLKGGYIELLWKRANAVDWGRVKIQPTDTEFRLAGPRRGEAINWQLRAVNGREVRSEGNFGTHVMAANTPAAGPLERGGNLVINSAFAWPMYGWEWGPGSAGATFRRPDAAERRLGAAHNAEIYSDDLGAAPGYLSQTFDVAGLRRYAFRVLAMARSANVELEVLGEARISSTLWEEVFRWRTPAITPEDCGEDPRSRDSYVPLVFKQDREDGSLLLGLGGRFLASSISGRAPERIVVSVVPSANNGDEADLSVFLLEPQFNELPVGVNEIPIWTPGSAQQPTFDARTGGTVDVPITTPFGVTYADDLGELSVRGGGRLYIRLEARVRMTSVEDKAGFAELYYSQNLSGQAGSGGRIVAMPASGIGTEFRSYGVYEKDLGVYTEGLHTFRISAGSRPDTGNGATVPPDLVIEAWTASLFFREVD